VDKIIARAHTALDCANSAVDRAIMPADLLFGTVD
jgi:hypothetical protein